MQDFLLEFLEGAAWQFLEFLFKQVILPLLVVLVMFLIRQLFKFLNAKIKMIDNQALKEAAQTAVNYAEQVGKLNDWTGKRKFDQALAFMDLYLEPLGSSIADFPLGRIQGEIESWVARLKESSASEDNPKVGGILPPQ